jgi:flagellar assembly factor FliW
MVSITTFKKWKIYWHRQQQQSKGAAMKLNTTRFGEIEVKDNEVIHFPEGVIGFPELKQWAIFDMDDTLFKCLQSLDDGSVGFIIMDPILFKPDYTFEVTEADTQNINLINVNDATIAVILCVPSRPNDMTANLKAPLVFNTVTREAKQVILQGKEYHTRHKVWDEITAIKPSSGKAYRISTEVHA